MQFTKDRGAGGQHRNKRETCVVLTHKATGITAKAAGKSQHRNREDAWSLLERRVQAFVDERSEGASQAGRRAQIGQGDRGDKIRTYRVKDNAWVDSRSGARGNLKQLQAGVIPG